MLKKNLICELFLFPHVPHLLVTVCPCNVRGNCKIAAKQLQGMPTIQSAVGILLGTFGVIGKQRGFTASETYHSCVFRHICWTLQGNCTITLQFC